MDLRLEAAHDRAAVEDEVPDLDHGHLAPDGSCQEDVDGSRPGAVTGDGGLGLRRPATGCRRGNDQVLASEVLDVSGQVCTRHALEEGSQLKPECGAAGRPGVDTRVDPVAILELRDLRLRDAGPDRHLALEESGPKTSLSETDAQPPRDDRSPSPARHHVARCATGRLSAHGL